MYPIVWLPLNENCVNNGLLMPSSPIATNITYVDGLMGKNPSFITTSTITMPLGTEYSHLWDGFSLSMFLKINNIQDTTKSKIATLRNSSGKTVSFGFTSTLFCEVDSKVYNMTQITRASFSNWAHLCITHPYSDQFHIFLNGVYLGAHDTSSIPIQTGDTTLILGDSTNCTNCQVFDFKLYDNILSRKKRLDDYYCNVVAYRFDGSGSLEDTLLSEYDASGYQNNGVFLDEGVPFTLTSTASPTRDYSTRITHGLQIPVNMRRFFINFWIYMVSFTGEHMVFEDRNYDVADRFTVSSINSGGNYLLKFAIGGNHHYVNIALSSWYMISISYQENNALEIYINGVLIHTFTCDFSIVNGIAPYEYDGGFYIKAFSGTISDYKQFIFKPCDSEIGRLYRPSVILDGKSNVYVTDIVMDNTKTSFGFDRKGKLITPNLEVIGYVGDTAMTYDYNDDTLYIHDCEEV